MKKSFTSSLLAVGALTGLLAQGAIADSRPLQEVALSASSAPTLTPVNENGGVAHVFPSKPLAAARANIFADYGPLTYHGGPIMPTVTSYAIYWVPPKLQNGAATGWSSTYQNVQTLMLQNFQGHSLATNNTQYYQTINGVTSYISNAGSLGGAYVDTSPYPASGCTDSITPGNCLTDAQIQAEVTKVMALKGWTPGINKIFLVYTGKGEGSCYSAGVCAYNYYCAYHSYYGSTASPVIYANMPYAVSGYCTAGTSPNGNIEADSAASVASHELIESITDPLLNAWYTSQGNEGSDLCAWQYGTNTWGPLKNANQSWNGYLFELQLEYSNHAAAVSGTSKGCVQVGP
jgi:hypothetical protein